MKKFIYASDLKFGPDATKKQTFLFKADLEFAISEGYEYIQPKDGPVLKILSNNELVEVDVTEEELQAQAKVNPKQVEFDPDATSEIFKSKHDIGDTSLFFEDVKKCLNNGISFIEDPEGFGYKILREGTITAIYGPDSELELEDEEDVCLHCENKELIINHINRILKADAVSEKDTEVMLNLAILAKTLDGVE